MKLILGAKLILILLFVLPLDAVHYDASALYPVEAGPKAYAEHYLTFTNWMRSSNDQRKMLISGYLRLLETDGLSQIPAACQARAGEILGNTSSDELVPYINKTYTYSKKALRASGGGVETIIFQYVRNRLKAEKNHRNLLEIAKIVSTVKNAGSEAAAVHIKDDIPEYAVKHNNIFETPKKRFLYDGWQSRTHDEKINLVTGYAAFLNILIKEDFCLNEEERRRFDLYCKLVSVNELVKHVDSLYENKLYRDEGAQILIYKYMIYNFQNYIGDPLAYWG